MLKPPAWPVTAALGGFVLSVLAARTPRLGAALPTACAAHPCITTSVIFTVTFLLDDTVLIEVGV